MKTLLPLLLVVVVGGVFGCTGRDAQSDFGNVSPDELESLLNAGDAVAVDANGPSMRSRFGTIPDAVLLSDNKTYDPAEELPSQKQRQLVFYCANTMCGAAPTAAQRAKAAGYENVLVMKEGIMGWAKAGKSVSGGSAG